MKETCDMHVTFQQTKIQRNKMVDISYPKNIEMCSFLEYHFNISQEIIVSWNIACGYLLWN